MRIDLNSSAATQVSGEQAAQQTSGKASATASAGIHHEDRTTFTSGSATVASMVSAAMASPEVRSDKVASLRQSVSSGRYALDSGSIAGAILDEHA